MALTQVTGPYPIFTDLDGSPLDDGYLYIGAANQDPETNPIQVFWDSLLTIPATQPIRTNNGYAWRNGTPGLLYTATEFSITIRNKRNEFVLYSPVGYGFDPKAASASVVKNDFTGDGVETDFTLSASPSTILATNIFINGVYQEKDSYTLTGNVITFSIAPPLGSSIEILTNETGIINAGNANDISYTLNAPGATLQSVQTKLQQYVSVKDFGAVGDGITDDTAAFQAAFSSGEYGIFVPNGTYIVDSVTGSDIYLFGSGTIKKKAATKDEMIYLTGSNVIEGVTFDYDWTNAAQTLPYFANISLRQDQGVITVRNCKFVRSFARALYVEGATLTLSGSSFSEGAPHNNQSGGNERVTSYVDIQADLLTDEQFVEITGNSFVGTSLVAANLHLNPTGIFLNAQTLDGVRYKSVNIVGNTMIACSQNAGAGNVTGAIDTYDGVENLVISGNTIRLFSYAGIKVQNSSNVAITGNIITDGGAPAGAAVDQSHGIILAEKVRSAVTEQYNGVIANNIIKNCKYIAIQNSLDNVAITGNIIDTVIKQTLGTAIYNTGSYVTIIGNAASNVGGTMIYTSADRVKIIGNDLNANGVAGSSDVGISFANTDNIIIGNTIFSSPGSLSSGIRTNAATNAIVDGNRVNGYNYGIDIRGLPGPTTNVDVGVNVVTNNGTSVLVNFNTVTNCSEARRTMPTYQFIYDAPSLAPGVSDVVQTLAFSGAALGDTVVISGTTDTKGLVMNAWVSAADTISYFLSNPTGNPNGTVDLNSALWLVTVTKKIQT